MGWGKSISKSAKSAGKSISKSGKSASKSVSKGAKDAGKAIDKGAKDAGKAIDKAASDVADAVIDTTNQLIDISKDTYAYAEDFAKDTAKRTESIQATVLKNTEEMAKIGYDVTSKEFQAMGAEVEKVVIDGVEVCYDAALEAYAWLNENICSISLSAALAMGVEAYFKPKPNPADPGTQNSTTLSVMAGTIILDTGKEVAKGTVITGMADVCVESFLLIPGVKGQVNARILKNVLANCIDMTFSSATAKGLWLTPVGVGTVIAAWICPVIANMICTRTVPKGFADALEG